MKRLILLLVLIAMAGYGMGERMRYVVKPSCTENSTGVLVSLYKCKDKRHYTYAEVCYDQVGLTEVSMSFCKNQ